MAKFYFTYGTDGQPFFGGWTEVEAPDAHAACAAFRAYHPDKTEGLVNCSSIYDEEKFKLTGMYRAILVPVPRNHHSAARSRYQLKRSYHHD